jgi:hypothetical protein
MSIEVRTSVYEGAHGKKPRGYGRWAFYMGKQTDDPSKVIFFMGTFSEAKRQACAKARGIGITVVTVGS